MPTLDEIQRKQRQDLLEQSIKDISAVLTNKQGLRRLRAISDAAWKKAEVKDAERLASGDNKSN